MGNMNNATTGAMQGAQLGGSVGGAWGAVGGAVIGGVVGYNTADPVQEALKAQKKYNDLVITNTVTDLFNTQRNHQVERMRTARALQSYQAQGKTQISTVRAGMGAADLIGSSAVALAQAIDYQTKQAEAATMFNYEVGFDNYLTSINQISQQGVNSLQQSINAPQQQGVNLGDLFSAGKDVYKGVQQMTQRVGFSAGLQFGSGTPQSASTNPMPSNYSLQSNLNLQFKGF